MADENKKQAHNAPQNAKAEHARHHPLPEPQKHSEEKGPLEECEQGLAELNDRYLRISAEYDNYKKRTAKEKSELCTLSEGRVLLRLLPVYEEIALAEKEVGRLPEGEAKSGTLLVLSKLRAGFGKEGLQQMELVGAKLDPFRHEVAFREDASAPEGTIVRVIRNGYLHKGEVLQHALVSVSSGKAPEGGSKEADGKGSSERKEEREVSP